jgi:hypothetical protein
MFTPARGRGGQPAARAGAARGRGVRRPVAGPCRRRRTGCAAATPRLLVDLAARSTTLVHGYPWLPSVAFLPRDPRNEATVEADW